MIFQTPGRSAWQTSIPYWGGIVSPLFYFIKASLFLYKSVDRGVALCDTLTMDTRPTTQGGKTMTQKEFIKAVNDATTIYGYVRFSSDSGEYIQLDKQDLKQLAPYGDGNAVDAFFREDSTTDKKILVIG